MQAAGLNVTAQNYSQWIGNADYKTVFDTLIERNTALMPSQEEVNNEALVGNIKSSVFVVMGPAMQLLSLPLKPAENMAQTALQKMGSSFLT